MKSQLIRKARHVGGGCFPFGDFPSFPMARVNSNPVGHWSYTRQIHVCLSHILKVFCFSLCWEPLSASRQHYICESMKSTSNNITASNYPRKMRKRKKASSSCSASHLLPLPFLCSELHSVHISLYYCLGVEVDMWGLLGRLITKSFLMNIVWALKLPCHRIKTLWWGYQN